MNINSIKDCFGCGVCSIICPKKIIDISLNRDGFYEPHISNIDACINCSLCISVCSYSHEDLANKTKFINTYAVWSKDSTIRKKSSSGGVCFEISRILLEQKYKICGVLYNTEEERAEHYIATNLTELMPLIGSKYIQSYTINGFKEFNNKDKFAVIGTPCQIDSLRRYIKKLKIEDNFILIDFFCHGVPSMWLWRKYLNEIEKKIGKATNVSWRNKETGWHNSYIIHIKGENNQLYSSSTSKEKDKFFELFLSDSCLNKACYDRCRFKCEKSSADFRVGDLWGKSYGTNEEGISACITFSEKADNILAHTNCIIQEEPLQIITEGQMKCPAKRSKAYPIISKFLNDKDKNINDLYIALKKSRKKDRIIKKFRGIFQKIKTHF